ncbi:MAG: TMEM175 family protein [Kangiellaceae bacterium]|jgi:uncharacterized membrane protein|nr:TMEM175 family protein [Kangiellaceae bacterium]
MTELTQSHSFKSRGDNMSRLETFVAAAFAFAVTMLIISVDDVPSNFQEFLIAVKLVPSFAASFTVIVWIWASHANWCKRYGLEDGISVTLSCSLVFIVLVYIFPLRLMMQGLFAVLTDGYLPSEMSYNSAAEVRLMFAFYAVGFVALALNFFALYHYAYAKQKQLGLSSVELFITNTDRLNWILIAVVSLFSLSLAISLPAQYIGWAGYSYFLLFPVLFGFNIAQDKKLHGQIKQSAAG